MLFYVSAIHRVHLTFARVVVPYLQPFSASWTSPLNHSRFEVALKDGNCRRSNYTSNTDWAITGVTHNVPLFSLVSTHKQMHFRVNANLTTVAMNYVTFSTFSNSEEVMSKTPKCRTKEADWWSSCVESEAGEGSHLANPFWVICPVEMALTNYVVVWSGITRWGLAGSYLKGRKYVQRTASYTKPSTWWWPRRFKVDT